MNLICPRYCRVAIASLAVGMFAVAISHRSVDAYRTN